MKTIAVIILNYNGKENTMVCLDSLQEATVPKEIKLRFIIVDNSKEDISSSLSKKSQQVEVIENAENLGFSGGNNVGIRKAVSYGDEYILILNNDTYVDKSLYVELLKAVQEEGVGVAVPKIYFAKGYEFHKDRYDKDDLGKVIWYAGGMMDWKNVIGSHRGVDEVDQGQFDNSQVTQFSTGCCMLVKREVFEKVGFFDERYFLYYEDQDFSVRVRKAGYTIQYTPSAVVWHKNAEGGGGSGSMLQDYYITRNRLLFGMAYAGIRAKIALFRESVRLLFSGRQWQKKGVRDFYLGRFGKGNYKL